MTRADRNDRDIARCDTEIAAIRDNTDTENAVLSAMGDADWRIEREMIAAERAKALEKRRVEFTIPQFHLLMTEMRMIGVRESHRPELDRYEAEALYLFAEKLPYRTTRQHIMREAILKRLEWAKPERRAKTLAEVL